VAQGEQHHPRGRLLRRLVVVLVVVVALVGVAQWRLDLTDRLGLDDQLGLGDEVDPHSDPGAVAAPKGLDLPDLPAAESVAQAARAGAVDPDAVRRALAPYVGSPALRRHLDVVVAGLDGQVVYRRGSGVVIPASTTKLLTSTAALETMGADTRFTTSVVRVPNTRRVVLVGGGDPFLASTATKAAGLYPPRATTATLAAQTAAALRAQGVHRVRLAFDDFLFTGPTVNPAWPATYVPENVVPPISALWVDEGRTSSGHYAADPAAAAAATFATQLKAEGIRVAGTPVRRAAPSTATELARVRSAPLGEIVERLLSVSDNNAAEVVARHVGLATHHDGSFTGAAAAVRAVLDGLGISTAGLVLHDGSGLSRENRLDPQTLVDLFRIASSAEHPELRDVVTGLPVAGFNGSLASRYVEAPAAGRGRVRAKTGTLTGVSGLAGIATDLTGTPMIVIAMADHVRPAQTLKARAALDAITAAVGACRCGGG
jgi:D-alanyl-D-alanine carboxypeptidase/D-alanyl-D-alanine-endopeptidase (penicillin-binding protein 4)